MTQKTKPTILWVLQNNQVSPIIIEFLKLLKKGIGKINIQFIAPANDSEVLEMIKPLNPITFQAGRQLLPASMETFQKKRDLIPDAKFTEGLEIWKALILDDLGGGIRSQTTIALPHLPNIHGIILQIPTPLGSSTPEELIFYEWVKLAHDNNVFISGYELLPLYTRWTLVPSILDGIITTNELSFNYLTDIKQNIKGKIWKLPRYEGKVFSPGTSALWQNGLQSPYHYRAKHNIPKDKTIFFIPHNVAMTYEYRRLIEEMLPFANDIHLMFCIGDDQVRGTHSHEQIIETISSKALEQFCSHSFHSLSAPWEMVMADAVLAVTLCYSTTVAEANGIPCIVIDNMVPETSSGNITVVNSWNNFRNILKPMINHSKKTNDFTEIIYEMINSNNQKISYDKGGNNG